MEISVKMNAEGTLEPIIFAENTRKSTGQTTQKFPLKLTLKSALYRPVPLQKRYAKTSDRQNENFR